MEELARRVVEAYGGEALWRRAGTVRVELSAWGWAFRLKGRAALRHGRAELTVGAPRARLAGINRRGDVAVLEGHRVRVESADGRVRGEKEDGRAGFPYGRRALYWDDLDQGYFAAYAAWNYFTLPALLLREDVRWTQESESVLAARFPPELPTHSAEQRFHFDPVTGLLRQHDYTADVFGGWAKAAHLVLAHAETGGVRYTSSRRARPRGPSGRALPAPLLVGIEVHAFEVG